MCELLLPAAPAITAMRARDSAAIRWFDGPKTDQHGPTADYLEAWLWHVCDADGWIPFSGANEGDDAGL